MGNWVAQCLEPPGFEMGCFVVVVLKISADFLRAAICSSPIDRNGFEGCGLVSAAMRSFAGYIATSCEDTLGKLQLVGKNSTISQIRVPCVFGI